MGEIAGDKYVKEDINVNIDNSAAIDGKEILCEINEPTEDTIGLLFKAYVMDKVDVSSQVCSDCDGIVTLTLRKPTIQKKEEAKLEEKLEEKLKKEYGATNVNIDNKGVVTADVSLKYIRELFVDSGPGWEVDGEEVEDIDICRCQTTTHRPEVELTTSSTKRPSTTRSPTTRTSTTRSTTTRTSTTRSTTART